MTKLIKRNRAIKYNPANKYWYIEGDNGTKYKQLKDGEIVTTNNGTVQYFSNGVKKNLSKSKPDVTKVVQNLWEFENTQNKGYDLKTKTYKPYRTANGNLDVANGIDLEKNPQYLNEAIRGISKERANQIASEILSPETYYIDRNLRKYTQFADTISPQMKEGLLDMYWQTKNGLYDFQKLFKAIADGDIEDIRKESVTYYKNRKGKYVKDSGRHKRRLDNYFHYNMGGTIKKRFGK